MNIPSQIKINSPFVIYNTFENETIIINIKSGFYYCIDTLAAAIWEIIEKKADLNILVEIIAEYFNIPAKNIESSNQEFLSTLLKENLIVEDQEQTADVISLNKIEIESLLKGRIVVYKAPVLYKYSDMQDMLKLDPIYDTDKKGWPLPKKEPTHSDTV
jgi:hypothetical protein